MVTVSPETGMTPPTHVAVLFQFPVWFEVIAATPVSIRGSRRFSWTNEILFRGNIATLSSYNHLPLQKCARDSAMENQESDKSWVDNWLPEPE
jgi:hypothetical protein